MPIHPFDLHVGHRIKVVRIQSKITQLELAEALQISFQQIQKYENGTNRISCSRLYQISCYLKKPISYFWDGFDDQSEQNEVNHSREQTLLDSAEAITLLDAYKRIDSGKVRKSILALTEEFAEKAIA